MYEALINADALLVLTEWGEFRNPDYEKMSGLLSEMVIFDGRNVYDLDQMKAEGFQYISMGRTKVKAKKRVLAD